MPDHIGQQLGNYQLLRLLGEGGFAEVYLGEHIHLGIQAAIKVLHTQLTSNDVDKFRAEAKTLARLIHPHIVRILEFGIESKTPYLIMDYAQGGTLRQRHPKGSVLPLSLIVDYALQIADALQYAHNEKVIHRDIKPENMLLGRRNEILLSDFGIALVAQSSRYQSTEALAGTMAYMAPEQIQGKPRPASDQYALGIVVYEWLTGDRPFHGSLTELVGQHLSVAPPSLQEKVSTILPEVDRIVQTALAKDSKQRFESVQAFANALHEAAQLSPSTGMLSPAIKAQVATPAFPPELVSQPPKPEALVPDLAETESAHLEPATQIADIPSFIQHSTMVLHSSLQDLHSNAAPPSSQKRRLGSRSSVLIGGTLGLISLLVVLILTFKPILFVRGGLSAPLTTRWPTLSATPTHPVQKWFFSTSWPVYSSPTVVNGVLYVGSNDGKVYAIDVNTGHEIWAFPTGDWVESSPTVVDGVLYVGSNDGKIYAIDATTGHEIWAFPTGNRVRSSPTVVNGVLYIGSDDNKVYAIDATTGHEIWASSNGGDTNGRPEVINGMLYIGSMDGKVYAIDAATGHEIWTFPTGGYAESSPTVVNGVLYIGSQDNKVYAIDATTGHEIWAFLTGNSVYSSPTVVNGVLYIGSWDNKVYAINANTGHEIWAFPTEYWVASSPTVVNGVLYIGSDDNKVYAIDVNTGHEIWAFPTGDKVNSSPTVVNGVLYIGSDDHKVYALILPV